MFKKNIKTILAHPVLSGSAIMVGGSLAGNGINYLYHFIMGRALRVEDYGNLAALYSLIYVLSIFPMSLSLSIVKFISSQPNLNERSKVYWGIKTLIHKIAIVTSVLFILLSPTIANFLKIESVIQVMLIAPIFYFTLITLVNQSSLQAMMKFTGVVIPNFLVSIVKLVVGLFLVLLGYEVGGAMVGVLTAVVLGYLVSNKLLLREKLRLSKPVLDVKNFLKYSLPVLIQALAFTSFFSTDVILVKHFFDSRDAGLYAALSMAGKIIFFAAQPITGVMFPVISTRSSKGEKYIKVLLMSVCYTLVICVGALAVFLFLPKLALVLYGQQYYEVADKLVWMGMFISIYTLANLLINFFLSIGQTKAVLIPVGVAILQIIGITFFHQSLLQVIQVSLLCMTLLSIALVGFSLYSLGIISYEKRK